MALPVLEPAFAQEIDASYQSLIARERTPVESVTDRVRPEYEPRKVRVGTTIWTALLDTSVIYDDNVFGSVNKRSDAILRLNPRLVGATDWPRHSASLSLSADHLQYKKYDDENRTDAAAVFNGVLDVRHNANVALGLAARRVTEERGTDDSIRSVDEPIQSRQFEGSLLTNISFARLYVIAGGRFSNADYDDTTLNGVAFDQDYRDGTTWSALLRLGYELTTMTSAFVEYRRQARRFDDARFDSDGNRVVTGLAFQASRLLEGSAYAGIVQQDFRDTAFEDVSSWTFGGDLTWRPTPLLAFSLYGSREADESSTEGSSIDTLLGVSIAYEVRRNVMLTGSYERLQEDFQDGDTDTTDSFGLEARYLINRTFSVGANFIHERVESDLVVDYNRNRIALTVRAQF